MTDDVVTTLLLRLDSARGDLRAVRVGLTIAREYGIWDQQNQAPTRLVGSLLEVMGGDVIAFWTPNRVEILQSLESFDLAYPERRLVLRRSGDSAALRAMLLPDKPRPGSLTAQELHVIRLIAEGKSNKEIAQAMCLSVSTVKNHLTHIFVKIGVPDRMQLALKALDMRLLPAYQT